MATRTTSTPPAATTTTTTGGGSTVTQLEVPGSTSQGTGPGIRQSLGIGPKPVNATGIQFISDGKGLWWALLGLVLAGTVGLLYFRSQKGGEVAKRYFKIMLLLLVTVVAMVAGYAIWVRYKASKGYSLYAVNDADLQAFYKILNFVRINDPAEYVWWVKDLALYMPGGDRSSAYWLGEPDLPGGGYSLSLRALRAMAELQLAGNPNNRFGANGQIYDFTNSAYDQFKTTIA